MYEIDVYVALRCKDHTTLLEGFTTAIEGDYHSANAEYICSDCGAIIAKGEDYTPFYYKPMQISHKLRFCISCLPLLDRVIRRSQSRIKTAIENKTGWDYELADATKALADRELELLQRIT